MWQYPVSLLSYLAVAVIVIFLSIKLSTFVDLLDKKTNLSGALLGGVLLAATTSLPELFTSLTATLLVKDNSLVVGDILGSNLFNIMLFAIIYFFFFKKMLKAKVSKHHIFSMFIIGTLYGVVTLAGYVFNFYHLLWGWFNPLSILIVVIYGITLWKTPKEEVNEEAIEDEKESKLSVKQIAVLFSIFALGLIGASIGITYLTSWVVNVYGFGSTFGGALFLGVATSLPELTSTINLCKKRNFDAAYGNILGSCVFNFFILAFSDVLSFRCGPLYNIDQSSFLLIVGTVFVLLIFPKSFQFLAADSFFLQDLQQNIFHFRPCFIAFNPIDQFVFFKLLAFLVVSTLIHLPLPTFLQRIWYPDA